MAKTKITLDFSSIISILKKNEKFLYCINEKESIEIVMNEDDAAGYDSLEEGIDRLKEEAEHDECYDQVF